MGNSSSTPSQLQVDQFSVTDDIHGSVLARGRFLLNEAVERGAPKRCPDGVIPATLSKRLLVVFKLRTDQCTVS